MLFFSKYDEYAQNDVQINLHISKIMNLIFVWTVFYMKSYLAC